MYMCTTVVEVSSLLPLGSSEGCVQLLVNSTHLCRVSLDNEFNRLAVTACVSVEPSLQVSECSMHVLYMYMYMYMCVVDLVLTRAVFSLIIMTTLGVCLACTCIFCMYFCMYFFFFCMYMYFLLSVLSG